MSPAFSFVVAIWLSAAFNLGYKVFGEDTYSVVFPSPTLLCQQNSCLPLSPPSPPLSGIPSYGAQPQPPSPPSFSGYPSYGAPPPPPSLPTTYPSYGAAPPPPLRPAQAKCPPPPSPIQCCQYPTNLNPNEYVPLGDHSPTATPSSPLSTFSIAILLLSFAVIF